MSAVPDLVPSTQPPTQPCAGVFVRRAICLTHRTQLEVVGPGSASALTFSGRVEDWRAGVGRCCWTHESAQRSLLVAARVVAKPPKVALYTEGFDRFVTSTTTPIATGWSSQLRVGLSPTERAHVFTAHAKTG